MGFHWVCFLLLASAAVALSKSVKHNDPLPAAFAQLPKEEKDAFLIYHLAVGVVDQTSNGRAQLTIQPQGVFVVPDALDLKPEMIQKFEEMHMPSASLDKLLTWTKDEFKLSEEQIKELVIRRKVQANGTTYDIPGIGGLCCPW